MFHDIRYCWSRILRVVKKKTLQCIIAVLQAYQETRRWCCGTTLTAPRFNTEIMSAVINGHDVLGQVEHLAPLLLNLQRDARSEPLVLEVTYQDLSVMRVVTTWEALT